LKFVTKESNNTIEIKKSKFITYICPYSEFKSLLQTLKDTHTKARHFVYAYRYLNEFHQIVENSCDDKEPKGTSGKPCLSVLNGANIINTAVIVVRYFGGTRLGTGGLVRAYSDAVNEVCRISVFKQYEKLIEKSIEVQYNNLSKMKYQLETLKIDIVKQSFDNTIILQLSATQEKFDKLFKS
jgi:uncharacterized YigZ family protein